MLIEVLFFLFSFRRHSLLSFLTLGQDSRSLTSEMPSAAHEGQRSLCLLGTAPGRLGPWLYTDLMTRYFKFWAPVTSPFTMGQGKGVSHEPLGFCGPGGSGARGLLSRWVLDCTIEIARSVSGPCPGQHHVPAGAASFSLAAPRVHARTQGVPRALRGLRRILEQQG